MDWTDIIVAVIAAAGGAIGAIISNNKRLSVFEAVITTKLDQVQAGQKKLEDRIDQHNHFNDRITKLEVQMEERTKREADSA